MWQEARTFTFSASRTPSMSAAHHVRRSGSSAGAGAGPSSATCARTAARTGRGADSALRVMSAMILSAFSFSSCTRSARERARCSWLGGWVSERKHCDAQRLRTVRRVRGHRPSIDQMRVA